MTELRFTADLPMWLILVATLALPTLAWLIYRRELRQGVWGIVLPGLRALAVLLIVLMLAGPELVHKTGEDRRGRVVLLVDRSASMGVSDPQIKDEAREKVLEALDIAEEDFDEMPRLERAEKIVFDLDRGLLSELRGKYAIDIIELRGDKSELLWTSSEDDTPPDGFEDLEGSESTDLGGFITRTLDDAEETSAGRLVFALLTDGRHNQGDPLGQVAARARAAGAPVHAIALGALDPPHDLAVAGIDHPPTVLPDDRITGSVALIDAMPAGKPFTLEIVAEDKVMWSARQVTVGGGFSRSIEFDFPAEQAVELVQQQSPDGLTQNQVPVPLTARIVGLEEDLEERNNEMSFQVRAVTGKRQMLILAGRARWEMRYLDSMFTRDPRWEVTTLMGGPGVGRAWQRSDEGEAFPKTKERLFAYDVVVLGELPKGTLSDEELTWLYEFVSNRAGGLIVMDGRRGHFASYGDSPIAALLPERLDQPTLRPNGLLLTAQGQSNATLRLEPDAQLNNETWENLPSPTYVAPIKPSAGIDQVLVEVGVGRADDPPMPAVLTRRVGAGWVWYSAIDETWRWRRDVESLYQNRYWQQVTNRVVEPLYASEDKFVSLGVDDAVVESGSEIPVRVRLRDDEGKPRLSAEASVYLETQEGERIVRAALSPDAVEGGRFTAELEASVAPGIYRVGVEVDGVSESDLLAKTLVTILGTDSASGELADITLNRELLDTLAQTTGGQVLAEHEANELPGLLEGLSSTNIQEQVSALWIGWPWFASVVGILALELGLRRRLGML